MNGMSQSLFVGQRDRTATYPTAPRTDPGVRDYGTGLFRNTRFPQQPKPLDLPRFSTSSHPDALDACYVTSW